MDIRTKLIFTLVAVALASMFVLGMIAYDASRAMLQEQALRQLEAIAEGRKDDLARARAAWGDRARLIASRTQLRLSLVKFQEEGDDAERARMERILADARGSVRGLLRAAVLDAKDRVLATAGDLPEGLRADLDLRRGPGGLPNVARMWDGRLIAVLHEPMVLDGDEIGTLRVVISADELAEIALDYTGLGETGETLVVRSVENAAEILTPLRAPDRAPQGGLIPSSPSTTPSLLAAQGRSGTFVDVSDYGGRKVWAATRSLEVPPWGVVVKIDAEEAERPAHLLRERLTRLALALSGLGVLAGYALALFISQPIRELADVAGRIRAGEGALRANEDREDEIGELARAFNSMTDELVTANEALQRRGDSAERDGETPSP